MEMTRIFRMPRCKSLPGVQPGLCLACKTFRHFHQAGPRVMSVSINVFPVQDTGGETTHGN
jgi:hypothetical protein